MDIINTKELIGVMHDETDITINEITDTRCRLAHAPLDVSPKDILLDKERNLYIELSTVIDKLETEVFGAEVIPMYNSKGTFTHVLVAA